MGKENKLKNSIFHLKSHKQNTKVSALKQMFTSCNCGAEVAENQTKSLILKIS